MSPKSNAASNNVASLSEASLRAELEKLRAENEALKAKANRPTSIKFSEKGGVSVYGMGRFPVTMYGNQWVKLSKMMPEILKLIADNEGKPVQVKDTSEGAAEGATKTIIFKADKAD